MAVDAAWILPQIKTLPSPAQQQSLLAAAVAERTAEKEALINEINHRIGNQLQVLSALVRFQLKDATSEEAKIALRRIEGELTQMGAVHLRLSAGDYAGSSETASVIRPPLRVAAE